MSYLVRAEMQTARELAEQLLRMAQSVQEQELLVETHGALGISLFYVGEFASARTHLEQSLTLYDAQQHGSHAFLYGQDPGVACLSYIAYTLWYLGYPDQALEKSSEALVLAQEQSHPFSLAHALNFAAVVHQLRQEGKAAEEHAEALTVLSNKQGFAYRSAIGTMLRGWVLAEEGQREEGISQMRQGMVSYQATGAQLAREYFLALLAEIYGEAKQTEEGLEVLTEAQAVIDKTGERYYEAELYRLKGTLMLQSKIHDQKSKLEEEAEKCC